jgi:hypothetical protein
MKKIAAFGSAHFNPPARRDDVEMRKYEARAPAPTMTPTPEVPREAKRARIEASSAVAANAQNARCWAIRDERCWDDEDGASFLSEVERIEASPAVIVKTRLPAHKGRREVRDERLDDEDAFLPAVDPDALAAAEREREGESGRGGESERDAHGGEMAERRALATLASIRVPTDVWRRIFAAVPRKDFPSVGL